MMDEMLRNDSTYSLGGLDFLYFSILAYSLTRLLACSEVGILLHPAFRLIKMQP